MTGGLASSVLPVGERQVREVAYHCQLVETASGADQVPSVLAVTVPTFVYEAEPTRARKSVTWAPGRVVPATSTTLPLSTLAGACAVTPTWVSPTADLPPEVLAYQ